MMQFDKFLSRIFFINVTIRECNFAMGTILGKGFAQALVHTSQHLCLCKTLSQDCPHGEIRQTFLIRVATFKITQILSPEGASERIGMSTVEQFI